MKKLAQLEARKLLRELEFLSSDLEYKQEVLSDADGRFLNSVNEFLSMNPELKNAFDDVINRRLDASIKRSQQILSDETAMEVDFVHKETDPKLKKIYWDIAKLTHPDKVGDTRLNELYLEAGKSYREEDIIGLYSVCEKVGIDYVVDEDDIASIRSQIEKTKGKIDLLQSTATWAWNYAESEAGRQDIVVRYVGAQLR